MTTIETMNNQEDNLAAIRKDVRAIRWVVTIAAGFYLLALLLEGLGQLVKHFM